MKFYLKPVLSVVVLAILLGYAGCSKSKDPGPSEQDQALTNLSATWKVGTAGNVTQDGVSKKADYTNFTLTISGTPGADTFNYTTTGRPPLSPWPASGTWKFGTTVATDIVRDSGDKALNMNYVVSGSNLQLTFTYAGAGETARTSNVKGVWVFTLTK